MSLLVGVLAIAGPVCAETAGRPCGAPGDLTRLAEPLPRTAQRLAAGQPLVIVAIGSSSTAGAGASSPAASYPSRLEAELRVRFPGRDIRVLNRGINGEETGDMLARFDEAVLAEHPDLVIWQVGTNAVLRDRPLDGADGLLRTGIDRLRAAGADVFLINPQFAPKVITKHDVDGMIDVISATSKAADVGLFDRFAVMRHWQKVQGLPFESFLSPDGLHMNDWSYACVAKLLAGSIVEAATRVTAIARAPAGVTANALPPGSR